MGLLDQNKRQQHGRGALHFRRQRERGGMPTVGRQRLPKRLRALTGQDIQAKRRTYSSEDRAERQSAAGVGSSIAPIRRQDGQRRLDAHLSQRCLPGSTQVTDVAGEFDEVDSY